MRASSLGRLLPVLLLAAPLSLPAARAAVRPAPADALPSANSDSIVAVVNGDAITAADVHARERLFAISSGMPMTPDVLARLRPQVTRQLIDEKLRLQEMQRRKIVVRDREIADALANIERRNGMAPGALRAKLAAAGVPLRTLIDELRVEIGWGRVLRQDLGDRIQPTEADIAEQLRLMKEQIGKPEYHVAEIFIPVEDPTKAAEAQTFATTVITQLRAGAPFGVVAAQFSQSQTALQGGDLGWVRPDEVDPAVAAVMTQMPAGAISNPIEVAGGYEIITLEDKREIGNDVGTVLSIRQVFLPFPSALNPAAPTPAQREVLNHAAQLSKTLHSCDDVEAANKAAGAVRPADPGAIRLENVNPAQFRTLLASLPIGKPSPPLVSNDGIAVVMVCSRDQQNLAAVNQQEVTSRLIDERAELASRQLLRDLRRRAVIEQRSS